VTANYKLSFDLLRKNLEGMDVWILVLETFGINVWCAAGKGTFGSEELIRQIRNSQLDMYVSHRRLIVPQLGAPGVSADKVKAASGFRVKFGPVRAADIADYIAAGYKKSQADRSVQFGLKDRFILTGAEVANSVFYLLMAILGFALLSGIHPGGYDFKLVWQQGARTSLYVLTAYVSGAFLTPVFLPLLPFRQFGGKGLVMGMGLFGLVLLFGRQELSITGGLGWLLISGAISSYLAMNFTGASTFTSLSGVRKEMRIFVPIQILMALAGLSLFIISKLT
jgi:hypothetical protein